MLPPPAELTLAIRELNGAVSSVTPSHFNPFSRASYRGMVGTVGDAAAKAVDGSADGRDRPTSISTSHIAVIENCLLIESNCRCVVEACSRFC